MNNLQDVFEKTPKTSLKITIVGQGNNNMRTELLCQIIQLITEHKQPKYTSILCDNDFINYCKNNTQNTNILKMNDICECYAHTQFVRRQLDSSQTHLMCVDADLYNDPISEKVINTYYEIGRTLKQTTIVMYNDVIPRKKHLSNTDILFILPNLNKNIKKIINRILIPNSNQKDNQVYCATFTSQIDNSFLIDM